MDKKNLKPVIVLGGGGHAKVLIEILKLSKRNILGMTLNSVASENELLGIKVLGNDEIILNYSPEEIDLVNGLGTLPSDKKRAQLSKSMRAINYVFTSVIHPQAVISYDVTLKEGVQIMAGCILQPGVVIGRDTIINTGTIIDHDSKVGSNCHLSPGVTICGDVMVGDGAFIGSGATVINSVKIGKDVIIGAASIVYSDVNSNEKFIQPR
jgi:sugar O-acyltransferase (sialic acid O-acetyltransferase NeuD family)